MRLLLAPMEGLLDDVLRAVLTRPGGYDYAVSEFARVSGTLLPDRFFRRIASELDRDSFTPGGTPVRVQLLGERLIAIRDRAVEAKVSPRMVRSQVEVVRKVVQMILMSTTPRQEAARCRRRITQWQRPGFTTESAV